LDNSNQEHKISRLIYFEIINNEKNKNIEVMNNSEIKILTIEETFESIAQQLYDILS
jgi:hypothetical protein